jgi:3D (Asp-Asp-Asp) domain-containing protein
MKRWSDALMGGSLRMIFMLLVLVIVSPATARNGQQVRVETERILLPAPTIYEVNRRLSPRKRMLMQKGEPGLRIITRTMRIEAGRTIRHVLTDIIVKVPQPTVYQVGVFPHISSRGGLRSRSNFRINKILVMNASAYTPHRSGGGTGSGRTANGWPAGFGLVAVDPRIVPLGTMLYVEGYGMAIAADKGRSIKGHKIDLCYHSRADALRFGRRQVKVHVLK